MPIPMSNVLAYSHDNYAIYDNKRNIDMAFTLKLKK